MSTPSTPQEGRPVYQIMVDGRLSHYEYKEKTARTLAGGLYKLVGDKRRKLKEVKNNTGGINFIIYKTPKWRAFAESK